MGRVYKVVSAGVDVNAALDLMTIFAGTKAFKLLSVKIGQSTLKTVDILNYTVKRLSGTITNGSGGTAPTPQPAIASDTAATITAHANDTTRTSGTTSKTVGGGAWNVVNGEDYIWRPGTENVFAPGEVCVLSLDTAPGTGPYNTTVTMEVEELF